MRLIAVFCAGTMLSLAACSSHPTPTNNLTAANDSVPTPTAPEATPSPTPTPTPRDLSDLIDFADPAACKLGPNMTAMSDTDFAKFNDKTHLSVGTMVHLPGMASPIRSVVTHPHPHDPSGNFFVSVVPLDGVWHGLPVAGLAQEGYEESEMNATPGVVFSASKAQVVTALRKAGFKLSADGSDLDTPVAGGMTASTALTTDAGPGKTIFWCMSDSGDDEGGGD